MKKLKNLSLAIAIGSSLMLFSCKEKNETETTEETQVETTVDNTAVDTVTAPPPTTDTVPGVVSGQGDEQVP